jgi:hypothetical protein
MKPSVLAGLAAGVGIPAYGIYLRYRRDMNAARARLAAEDRHVVSTRWGVVEYAERGFGAPVLVVLGIYQNCVSGLFSVRDLFADRRVIAPSRFGYLGSSMPPNATPATQADAFATLLDALDIGQIDVGDYKFTRPQFELCGGSTTGEQDRQSRVDKGATAWARSRTHLCKTPHRRLADTDPTLTSACQ